VETRKCVRCGEWKEATKRNFRVSRNGGFKNYCRSCEGRLQAIERKLQMFDALGYECACCGERSPLLLSLDHVKNNGNVHRQKYQSHQIYMLARKQGWPKEDWQVLCMGCNWGKRFLGECPHKMDKTPEQVLEEMREVLKWKGKRFPRFQEKLADPEYKEKRPWKSQEMIGNQFAAGLKSKGGTRKLTMEQVKNIKALKGTKTYREVAAEFGVGFRHVWKIWTGRAWKEA
jgi:hypothetical protein